MERIDWKKNVLPQVRQRLTYFNDRGIVPTLRAMFYILFSSLEWFPNTKVTYSSLSDRTARWRENGMLPIDCFVDETRHVVEGFNDEYENPQQYVERLTGYLENASLQYTIPRWHNQPHYVEVWTEKQAQVGLLRSLLNNKQVRIVATKGYSGPSNTIPNVRRLQRWQAMDKQIHILYFGDMDPSGQNIGEVLSNKLAQYGLVNVDFQRLAVTDDQIREHRLPDNPDPETLKKLEKDSRRDQFEAKHGGRLFQVEIDALAGLAPDAFRDLVLNSVDLFYDEAIHQDALNQYTQDDITKMVKTSAKKLARRL